MTIFESGNANESLCTTGHDAPTTLANVAECREMWTALTERRLVVSHNLVRETRALLIMRVTETLPKVPVSNLRNQQILEGMLLGIERKIMSIDLGRAESTIAQILKQELAAMGLNCSPARVPPLLAMLVHAAKGATGLHLSVARFKHNVNGYVALSGNLDSQAWRSLAPAERAVLQHRLFGKSHADIAALRQTSRRTIANQLAAATLRLGTSSRFDLLRMMASAR